MAIQEYKIQGITYKTPKVPYAYDIGGSSLAKREQIWIRPADIPKGTEITDAIFNREWDRIINGWWFMCNGKPTYITGYHYFFLTYYELENGERAEYRRANRDFFYFWDYLEKNTKALGCIFVKFRREGASSRGASMMLDIGITESRVRAGVISKTGTDAEDFFGDMVSTPFQHIPEWLKPIQSGNTKSKKELNFSMPATRVGKSGKVPNTEGGLNNRLMMRDTAMNAYDSGRMRFLVADECFGAGTKILMSDMSFKSIEDICIGDWVIVEGGKKVQVGDRFHGEDEMYRVDQKYGKSYIVNSKHRLYLEQRCKVNTIFDDGVKIITAPEFLNLSKYRLRTTFGVKSKGLNFEHQSVKVEPYFLGLWLGDGDKTSPSICLNRDSDSEIREYLIDFCNRSNLPFREIKVNSPNCDMVSFFIQRPIGSDRGRQRNPTLQDLRHYGIVRNKHIPKQYIQNSREVRLQVLAGIIDTDGYLAKKGYCDSYRYEIGLSREELLEDIMLLCKTLGLRVGFREKITNFNTKAYILNISGNLKEIPVRVQRKKIPENYSPTTAKHITGIKISSIGVGEYYGIQLIADNDNDRRLILEDFTISMNCGKFPAKVPIYQYWQIVKKTLTQGGVRKGMCYMMSTVNEMEKSGGKQFRIVWNMSQHIDKQGNEIMPTSGLYSFFIPAYDGYMGYIDQFGESIIEDPKNDDQKKWLKHLHELGLCPDHTVGAKNYILGKRKKLQRQIELGEITEDVLHEEIRTEPFTVKEAFLEPAKDCIVPVTLLNAQVDWLEENSDLISKIKRRFNFYKIDGKVQIVEEPTGRWEGVWNFPNPEVQANRYSLDKFQKKMPINTLEFSIGLDPFAHNITVGSKGSMAGGYVRRKYVPTDPENSEMPIMQYWARPKLKSIMWNDMMLACEYFSCKLGCENVIDEFATYFDEHGMSNFYVWTPEDMMSSRGGAKKPGIPMGNGKPMEYHTSAIVEDFIHNHKKIYWMPLLEQLRHFDPNERTEFDLVMGHGYSLIAAKDEIRNILPKANTMTMVRLYDLSHIR